MNKEQPFADAGERLRRIRLLIVDKSSREVAQNLGVEVSTYRTWERGSRRISISAATKIAEQYGISLDYIYLGRVRPPTVQTVLSLREASMANSGTPPERIDWLLKQLTPKEREALFSRARAPVGGKKK